MLHWEPISRSFRLPYLPSESTLFHIFLFLEASPTGFFEGVYLIANHKRAVVLYCFHHMQAAWKHFNYVHISVFLQEIKELPTYLSSKNKKIGDRVDSRVQLVWRLQVMGSCLNKEFLKLAFSFEEGLTLEMSAFWNSLLGPIYIDNSVSKATFSWRNIHTSCLTSTEGNARKLE